MVAEGLELENQELRILGFEVVRPFYELSWMSASIVLKNKMGRELLK